MVIGQKIVCFDVIYDFPKMHKKQFHFEVMAKHWKRYKQDGQKLWDSIKASVFVKKWKKHYF